MSPSATPGAVLRVVFILGAALVEGYFVDRELIDQDKVLHAIDNDMKALEPATHGVHNNP